MTWNTRWIFVASVALFVCSATGLVWGGISDERSPTFLGTKQPRVGMHNDLPSISFEENYQRFGFGPTHLGNQYRAGEEFMALDLEPHATAALDGGVRYGREFLEAA